MVSSEMNAEEMVPGLRGREKREGEREMADGVRRMKGR